MLKRGADALAPRHVAWLTGLAALVLYCATLAHGFGWDDSGELATGVIELAPVHAAGYAPYIWLGHGFVALVPFVSDPTAVNLWSAFTAALAVALVARYVMVVSGSVAGAVLAGLLFATGPIVFFNATVAAVYAFLAFAVALLLNAADAWLRRPSAWRLASLALAIGLVGVAHAAGAAFAVGGLVFLAIHRRLVALRVRDLLPLALILLAPLSVVLLGRTGNSTGFPQAQVESTLVDVVWHTAKDLVGTLANAHGIAVHVKWLVLTLLVSLSPAALVLVPAGLRRVWRERPYVLCCLAPALVSTGVAIIQRGGYAYWFVPIVLAGAVACGVGLPTLLRRAPRPALAVLGVAMVVTPVAGAFYLAHSHREASDWSRATLAALPGGAPVVTPWISYTPLRAQQVVEGVRRDVRLQLTPGGGPVDVAAHPSDYVVDVSGDPPAPPAVPSGPPAGANFKGLSGLELGWFSIGFDPVTARAYRLPR